MRFTSGFADLIADPRVAAREHTGTGMATHAATVAQAVDR
jgi:hypothetical protein